MIGTVYDSLLTLAYPQSCNICRNSVESRAYGVACDQCWQKTHLFDGTEVLCPKCGLLLNGVRGPGGSACRRCDEHAYDRAAAIGVYELALAVSVLNLKREPVVPERLKKLLIAAFENSGFTNADLIIPSPISRKRLLERGFNQAEVLAAIISEASGIPVDSKSLARVTHTPMHRAAMDSKARDLTVRKAFEVKRPNLIAGKKVLLVDDVMTSGATSSHCAAALRKHGAVTVNVLTIARA